MSLFWHPVATPLLVIVCCGMDGVSCTTLFAIVMSRRGSKCGLSETRISSCWLDNRLVRLQAVCPSILSCCRRQKGAQPPGQHTQSTCVTCTTTVHDAPAQWPLPTCCSRIARHATMTPWPTHNNTLTMLCCPVRLVWLALWQCGNKYSYTPLRMCLNTAQHRKVAATQSSRFGV